jgi:Transmembrane family, TMEM144 of transporters
LASKSSQKNTTAAEAAAAELHMTVFDGCSDSCGWTAAFIALLCAGTYGVPIKETHHLTEVNPLVFQSFKTLVFFVLSLHVLLLGVPPRFTPWGILSGLLWVLGGTGGVVAVRMAGMAVAVGTWASVMICVNFVWGILIFHEPVANLQSTVAAFILLGLGLIGMSKFGAPEKSPTTPSSSDTAPLLQSSSSSNSFDETLETSYKRINDSAADEEQPSKSEERATVGRKPSKVFRRSAINKNEDDAPDGGPPLSVKTMEIDSAATAPTVSNPLNGSALTAVPFNPDTHVRVWNGCILRKRTAGILAALFNGSMSGSALIPMHYAKRQGGLGGEHFMISYGFGALFSNVCLWGLYFAAALAVNAATARKKDAVVSWPALFRQALELMPEWHVSTLWKPAVAAGTLQSVAEDVELGMRFGLTVNRIISFISCRTSQCNGNDW